MTQIDTKTRILDAAEQLFARDGFHITSLRALTEQAKVNLAAVNYHFGSKEGLLLQVFARRLQPLDAKRRERIEKVLAEADSMNRRPQVKSLLQAFIEPIIEFRSSEPAAKDFLTLIGRSLSEPDQTVRGYFIQQVLPIFTLLFGALQKALPQLPVDILMTRLQFTMGAMSHMMCNNARPDQLVEGLPEPLQADRMVAELLTFITAGLEAPC